MPVNFLHPFGFICSFPPVGISTTSCLYAVSISELLLRPCASQQLPACIWFQYLAFPCLSTTSCAHLVSISNFHPGASHQTSLTSCFHWQIGLQYLYSPGVAAPISLWNIGFPTSFPFCPLLLNFYSSHLCARLGSIHLASISKLPPPCASHQFPAFICLVSRLHPWPLDNFLHASQLGFNV